MSVYPEGMVPPRDAPVMNIPQGERPRNELVPVWPAVVSDDTARFTATEGADISRDMLRLFGEQDKVNRFFAGQGGS